jgi:hypothetical protein
MIKIENKYEFIKTLLILSVFIAFFNSCSSNNAPAMETEVVTTLTQLNISYFTDGAGGSDIMEMKEMRDLVGTKKEKLLPILIDNLSNSSTTNSVLDDSGNVPLGYVCFDLLCSIIETSEHWYDIECGDDGMWACVNDEYYIPFLFTAENMNKIRSSQNNWRKLLESGRLKLDNAYQ